MTTKFLSIFLISVSLAHARTQPGSTPIPPHAVVRIPPGSSSLENIIQGLSSLWSGGYPNCTIAPTAGAYNYTNTARDVMYGNGNYTTTAAPVESITAGSTGFRRQMERTTRSPLKINPCLYHLENSFCNPAIYIPRTLLMTFTIKCLPPFDSETR